MARDIVQRLYRSVIDEVISNVQEVFIDECVDEQTLMELKQMWEKKLAESKALEPETGLARAETRQLGIHRIQPQSIRVTPVRPDSMAVGAGDARKNALPGTVPARYAFTFPASVAQAGLQSLVATTTAAQLTQLLNSPQPNNLGQIPGVRYQVLTPQQLQNSQRFTLTVPVTSSSQKQASNMAQLDGANDDTSDEDSLSYSDDEDEPFQDDGIEEEPLNSNDDESDDDIGAFDADNIIVCQYEKIQRSKNRWKFHLKDGIMTVRGKDFVFHKALGDSEW